MPSKQTNTDKVEAQPDVAMLATSTTAVESAVLIQKPDMFDRIVEIGREARELDVIEIALPGPIPGLPDKIDAIVKYTATGPVLESVRPLFKAFETAPERRTGTAKVTTLVSFAALINRHKDDDSAIFAQTVWPNPKLTAILDYHKRDGGARYGTHKIEYAFPITEEFKAWMKNDGVPMGQGDFALFLENHVNELAAPYDTEKLEYEGLFKEKIASPNEVVALSRDLEIHVGAKVKRKERLQTGERSVVFESEHINARGEPVEIPGVFMIAVATFIDGDPVRIPARLRYRISGGDIVWFYQLYRPEFWLRTQVQNDLIWASVETGLPSFEGAPEAA